MGQDNCQGTETFRVQGLQVCRGLCDICSSNAALGLLLTQGLKHSDRDSATGLDQSILLLPTIHQELRPFRDNALLHLNHLRVQDIGLPSAKGLMRTYLLHRKLEKIRTGLKGDLQGIRVALSL